MISRKSPGVLLPALLFVSVFAAACQSPAARGPSVKVVTPVSASTLDGATVRDEAPADHIPEADNTRPLKLPLKSPRIVVRKSARRLLLFSANEAVRDFPVGLGFSPDGDKVRQGDGRTPEGTYFVCIKNERSMFHLSLGITYPNEDDAERGLRDKLITRRQYERITSAAKKKQKPPWDTRLGGEIFIHGGGATGDWTWGCVALANEAVKELFDTVPIGTMVVIEP